MSEDNSNSNKSTVNAEIVEELTSKNSTHQEDSSKKSDGNFDFHKFTETLDKFFNKQLPSLPTNVKDILVKVIPYLNVVGLVIGVIVTVIAIPLLLVTFQFLSLLGVIVSIGSLVFAGMAVKGLFDMKKQGWTYSYYSCLVSLLSSLIALNITGLVIGGFVSGYILFQIRSYYK